MNNFAVFPSQPDPPFQALEKPKKGAPVGNISARTWTAEHDAALKRMRTNNFSSAQIAVALNGEFGTRYSRNAAIGRAHRLGLTLTDPRPQQPAKVFKIRDASKPRIRYVTAKVKLQELDPEPFSDLPIDVCPNRVTLLSCEPSHCRWPAADDGSAEMVCGDTKVAGYSWCARHARVAFSPAQQRRRWV
jgi:GcrA cell cycle regulator